MYVNRDYFITARKKRKMGEPVQGGFEERDNSGALFPVDELKTENHPNFTGKGLVNGTKIQISAWKKVSKAGRPYLSLSFREWVPPEATAGGDTTFDF